MRSHEYNKKIGIRNMSRLRNLNFLTKWQSINFPLINHLPNGNQSIPPNQSSPKW